MKEKDTTKFELEKKIPSKNKEQNVKDFFKNISKLLSTVRAASKT